MPPWPVDERNQLINPHLNMCAKTTTTASAASAMASAPCWADLLPELLCDIAGRLHVASDNVRFHAVCWAWRVAASDGYSPPTSLLPWLLAPSSTAEDDDAQAEDQLCRCVFSKKTYRAPGICVRDRRVAYSDGKAAWLVRGSRKEISLVNPLSANRLVFPGGGEERLSNEWIDHRHRIVSRDGSVLLYDFNPNPERQGAYHRPRHRFRASYSSLRPGSGHSRKWLHVSSDLSNEYHCCAAACYRGGDYVVCVDLANCHVLRPNWDVRAPLPVEPGKVRRSTYLLEYRGELLLASVNVLLEAGGRLSVSLHELRLETGRRGGEQEPEVEWVRRDESDSDMTRLGDHALFLGFPGSFAMEMEAALLGGKVSGGAAYFVLHGNSEKPSRVCRYRFGDAWATLVETLPVGWPYGTRCMWFLPDPQITTSFDPPEEGCGNSGDGGRRHQLRIYAGDLSPKVDSSRLREMFSVYGKVVRARVAYDKRGRSRGFGFVTMATQEGFDKAMAALNPVEEPDRFTILDWLIVILILLLIFASFYLAFRVLRAAWRSFF